MQPKFKRGMATLTMAPALGVASAGVQAQSSVTLYGQVDAQADATKTLDTSDRAWGVNSDGISTSCWGTEDSEDLGSGLKTIFMLEASLRPDTDEYGRLDGDTFLAHNSSADLQPSTWGSVKLDHLTPSYFVSTILFNPFIDSYTFSPTVFHTYLGNSLRGPGGISDLVGDSGWNNTIMCSTPDFNGLTANFVYGMGEQAGHNGQNKWGDSFLYFYGNLTATAALQQMRFDSAPGDLNALVAGLSRQTAAQLGITYDFGVAKVYGQYQYVENVISSGDVKGDGGQLGISAPVDLGNILASYAYTKTSGAADVKHNTWATGCDYSSSKRTGVYAAYVYDKVMNLSSANVSSVGIRARF